MSKICDICGQNSGMYPLCEKHAEMKQRGLIIKNNKTGKWQWKNDFNKLLKEKELKKRR